MHHRFDFKPMLVFELLQSISAQVVEPQVAALGHQDAGAGHAPKSSEEHLRRVRQCGGRNQRCQAHAGWLARFFSTAYRVCRAWSLSSSTC